MNRRAFIVGLGGAAAWPIAARAQQSVWPVTGFLDGRSSDPVASRLRAFRESLKDTGFVEGDNLTIAYANNGSVPDLKHFRPPSPKNAATFRGTRVGIALVMPWRHHETSAPSIIANRKHVLPRPGLGGRRGGR